MSEVTLYLVEALELLLVRLEAERGGDQRAEHHRCVLHLEEDQIGNRELQKSRICTRT